MYWNTLSLPQQDDCKTKTDTGNYTTKQGPTCPKMFSHRVAHINPLPNRDVFYVFTNRADTFQAALVRAA